MTSVFYIILKIFRLYLQLTQLFSLFCYYRYKSFPILCAFESQVSRIGSCCSDGKRDFLSFGLLNGRFQFVHQFGSFELCPAVDEFLAMLFDFPLDQSAHGSNFEPENSDVTSFHMGLVLKTYKFTIFSRKFFVNSLCQPSFQL